MFLVLINSVVISFVFFFDGDESVLVVVGCFGLVGIVGVGWCWRLW